MANTVNQTINYSFDDGSFNAALFAYNQSAWDKFCLNYFKNNNGQLFEMDTFIVISPPAGVTITALNTTQVAGNTITSPAALGGGGLTRALWLASTTPGALATIMNDGTPTAWEDYKTAVGAALLPHVAWTNSGVSVFVPQVWKNDGVALSHDTTHYPYNGSNAPYTPISVSLEMDLGAYSGTFPVPVSLVRTHMKCVCYPALNWVVNHVEDWLSTTPMLPC